MVVDFCKYVPLLLTLLANLPWSTAWVSTASTIDSRCFQADKRHKFEVFSSPDDWKGEVVSNDQEGKINGCTITAVGDEPVTEWIVTIDG